MTNTRSWSKEKADLAIVGDPMEAVIAAVALRRVGISVETYLSGNEKRQRKKAMDDARETMTVQQALELSQ